MNSQRKLLLASAMLLGMLDISNAQCPNVLPAYRDLEEWVHGNIQNGISHNYIEVHVVEINPVGLTEWGKGLLMQGVAGYGQCVLATNPVMPMYFSDRTYKTAGTDINGNSVANLNQPFSIRAWDKHVVSLDMVGNTITNKSLSWNATHTMPSVTRVGNVVYGTNNNGAMVILTLLKRTFTGNVIPAIEP